MTFLLTSLPIEPFEDTSKAKLRYKKGIIHIENELELLQETHAKLLEDSDTKIVHILYDEKKMAFLRNENKAVREELKRLNKLLTELVEFRRAVLKKKPPAAASSRGIPKPEVRVQEIKNSEKMLANLEMEYERMARRIEQISDPQYLLDLKERIISMDHRIKKAEKNKKTLETEQVRREKIIDKVIEDGEPELLQDINHLKTEAAIFEKKLREIDEVLERKSTSLSDLSTRLEALRGEWKKLSEAADKEGIKSDTVGGTARTHELAVKYKTLLATKEGLVKTLNLVKTRYAVTLGDYVQKKGAMQKQVSAIAVSLQSKNEYPFFVCRI